MSTAARLGERFGMDPLVVLGGPDGATRLTQTDERAAWLIRVAALRVCQQDDRARAKAQQGKG